MKNYKKIHIWEFPPTLTFVRLGRSFRVKLFEDAVARLGSEEKLLYFLNNCSLKYGIKRRHTRLSIYSWKMGEKLDKGSVKSINIPLWVLIELSKIISKTKSVVNNTMRTIEKNVDYYTGWGKSNPIIKPKLPLYLTPELVSVIFHFMGDGHIGRPGVSSSYRQMNREGLSNFLLKLNNLFGDFEYSRNEFADGRLNIPKIITEFYKYYFKLPNTNTFTAYLPDRIKSMDKEFLLAGLLSFIVDEGHIGEVLTIYSKNRRLLNDVREIAIKCGYECHVIREKYAYGRFDVYRFSISSKSYHKLNDDLNKLSLSFPTCSLAHKTDRFVKRIR